MEYASPEYRIINIPSQNDTWWINIGGLFGGPKNKYTKDKFCNTLGGKYIDLKNAQFLFVYLSTTFNQKE